MNDELEPNLEKKPESTFAKTSMISPMQTFDRIQWLKSRTLSKNLIDRTIQLKYLRHVSEINQYLSTRIVFNNFDDDGNGNIV